MPIITTNIGTLRERTIFIELLVCCIIFSTAFNYTPFSIIGLLTFFLIGIVTVITIRRINKNYIAVFLYLTFVFLCIHMYLSTSTIATVGLMGLMIVFYFCLLYYSIKYKHIAQLLLLIAFFNVIIGLPQIFQAPFTNNPNEFFMGIFRNPNTCGNFGCCFLCGSILFFKEKKKIILAVGLFCLYVIGCKSRNTFLFVVITLGYFYALRNNRYRNLVIPSYFILFITCLVYLIIIEPLIGIQDVSLMGKEGGSAGRSEQILLTMESFPLKFFGVGADLPNENSIAFTRYPVHNFFVNTAYGCGYGFICLYFFFCSYLYKHLKSNWAKAFILSFNIYFMFEPGRAFGLEMINSLPIILITLQYSRERYENLSLYI